MLQLICEGRCNPTLAGVQRTIVVAEATPVTHTAEDGSEFVRFVRGDQRLWDAQRALHHTAHISIRPYRAICSTCGTERQYGTAA